MQQAPAPSLPEDMDFGRTSASLSQTLRSSKLTSELFDPPLPPPESFDPPPVAVRVRSRYWSLRLYLSTSILLTVLVIYLLPHSVLDPVLTQRQGCVILAVLAAFAVIGVLDVLANDLGRLRALRATRDHRQLIYIGLALSILAFTYAIVRSIGWSPVLLVFVDDLVVALAVAPLDMLARHKEERSV